MVVYRCHDVWDAMPRIGIRDSWAAGLGFEGEPLVDAGYYRLDDASGYTFGSLCEHVAERVRTVGHECVLAVGDPAQEVSRIGLGTGAITKLEQMVELGADVCVICDDYFRYVREGALYEELGIPYIVVNHGAKEEWGMENLYEHTKHTFADLPVHFLPQGCPYRTVCAPSED
jgi:putative NIF3 family GTP cyclohydrolase 1 type 2